MFWAVVNVLVYLVGLSVITYQLVRFFRFFLSKHKTYPFDLAKRYGKGSYAVITGGSDGIGRAFAIELAKRNFNLVLIAKGQEKLAKVADELRAIRSDVEVFTIARDFADPSDTSLYEDIRQQIKDLDISILVNNVGMFYEGKFDTYEEAKIRNVISVNCLATTMMSRIVIPLMQPRLLHNAIINVSSMFSDYPLPYFALHSASKVFVDYISRGLAMEFEDEIDIMSLRPGYVATHMISEKLKNKWKVTTPEETVLAALDDLGHHEYSYGATSHKAWAFIQAIIPEMFQNYLGKIVAYNHIRDLELKTEPKPRKMRSPLKQRPSPQTKEEEMMMKTK